MSNVSHYFHLYYFFIIYFCFLSLTQCLRISDRCTKQLEWNGITRNQSCATPKYFLLNINHSIIFLPALAWTPACYRNGHATTLAFPASRAGCNKNDTTKTQLYNRPCQTPRFPEELRKAGLLASPSLHSHLSARRAVPREPGLPRERFNPSRAAAAAVIASLGR